MKIGMNSESKGERWQYTFKFIIHEIVALMNAGGTTQDLRNTIHIHPTLSEVFEALKDVTD